jgi:SAM-dependent methyltransferase
VDRPEGAKLLGDKLLVSMLRARSCTNDSLVYAHHVFAEVEFLARKHGARPQTVMEIGPGTGLGSLFCFVASGVQCATGIDIEPLHDPGAAFYRDLHDYLACVEGFSWWRYFATAQEYPHAYFPPCAGRPKPEEILARIDYRSPVSSDSLPFPEGSFDLVYSVAALEHMPKPAETVAEIARVLRPGGLSVHEIDVKDHGTGDLLDFLTWSDAEYLSRAQPYGEGRSLAGILDGSWKGEVFCNRLRLSDWKDIFDRQGFETLEVEPVLMLRREYVRRERFAEPFRSKSDEDLAVLAFRIVARTRA